MKISLIVPVYNVAPYLHRCLDSCINQNLDKSEYEIVVINDGSTDNSLAIINEYLKENSSIVLIDKENGGLSSARNAGLKIAKGDFVWFIDSDDWIQENCLKKIVDALYTSKAQVLTYVPKGSDGTKTFDFTPSRNLSNKVVVSGLELFESGYCYPYSGAQFYVFRRSFLLDNNLFFYEGILFEDLLFTARMMSKLQRCFYVDANYYYYYLREGSISKSKASFKKANDHILIARELANHIGEEQNQTDYILYRNIAMCILGIYIQWGDLCKKEQKLIRNNFFSIGAPWLRSIMKSGGIKYILPLVLLFLRIHVKFK